MAAQPPKASKMTQEEYLAILFADCGYHTARHRNDWLERRFRKKFPDELTVAEKSTAINWLKAEKDGVTF